MAQEEKRGGKVMSNDYEVLGEYADQGFWFREYSDDVITIGYKDNEIAAFRQTAATPEILQDACKRYMKKLTSPVGFAEL